MADSSAVFKGGAAPFGAEGGAPSEPPAGSSPNKATSVADVMQLMTSPTQLSKEGEAYIATIVDALTRSGREPKQITIIGPSYEARVLEYNKYITAFVFSETYIAGDPPYPPAWVAQDLRNRFTANGIEGEPALFLVVSKDDYKKVDIMASLVVNAYKCHDTPALRNFTAAGLRDSKVSYGLTDDMSVIKPFVERHHPFATLPRMDLGVMLYIKKPIVNEFSLGNGRPEFERNPVVAVTGYVDFVYGNSNQFSGLMDTQVKFTPFFVVTGIFSSVPDICMATIGLPLTAYLQIGKSFWAKQFSQYKKDKPNIGNLLTDAETGAPVEVADIAHRNHVIANYLTTAYPYMAVDLQFGSFIIPGLGRLIENSAEFNQRVDAFTGGEGATRAGRITQVTLRQFDGRYRASKTGEYLDTRCIDYLSLVRAGYPQADVSSFLQANKRADVRSMEITKVNPDAEFLYITHRAFLNPDWVIAVATDLNQTLEVKIDAAMELGAYDIGSLSGFGPANINNMPSFAVASTMGGFSDNSWCWG